MPWLTVFPIHPATSARIRKAFAPSGAKDDAPDAQVLLEVLIHHRSKLYPLFSDDAVTRRLAGLCELRRRSVDERTRLGNRLISTLKGYYPQALEPVGDNVYSPMALDFLKRWPDLLSLKRIVSALKQFYYHHNVRRTSAVETRQQKIAQAEALTTDEAIRFIGKRQVERIIQQMTRLQKHIANDEKLIRQAFAEHPEAELFVTCPGLGRRWLRACS